MKLATRQGFLAVCAVPLLLLSYRNSYNCDDLIIRISCIFLLHVE